MVYMVGLKLPLIFFNPGLEPRRVHAADREGPQLAAIGAATAAGMAESPWRMGLEQPKHAWNYGIILHVSNENCNTYQQLALFKYGNWVL